MGGMEAPEHITDRTFRFGARIMKPAQFLDKKPGVPRTLASQLLRAGIFVGAEIYS